MVLGKTHPNILKEYGEKYRTDLVALVDKLGLQEHVIFDDRFVNLEELCAWLMAADIYITPYMNEAQIVSGTLSYAVGAGTAIISTPYWHAQELLADGRGVLVGFADSAALAAALRDLLADKAKLKAMRARTYQVRAADALGNRRGKVPEAVPAHGGGRGQKVDRSENSRPAAARTAIRPGPPEAADR